MLRIRLARYGRKSLPFYKIVVIDSRKRRDGKHIAVVGMYNPITKKAHISREIYLNYLTFGAKPSEAVSKLFRKYCY